VRQSAQDAAARSTSMFNDTAEIVAAACRKGARLANASHEDLLALRRAFDPVYASLQRNPQTDGFIKTIEALKAATPAGRAIAIPPGCTGAAPGQESIGNPVAGRWRSGHIAQDQWIHAFIAAGGSETEAHTSWTPKRYVVITLRFDRSFTEFESADGMAAEQGYSATYRIVDDHTLTIASSGNDLSCVGTYRYDVEGDTLRLYVIKQCRIIDGPYNTALFATFPFTRAPGIPGSS
jgi:hypothetical protein